jgi:hypothetical protein
MAQRITIRRGTEASRLGITPNEGELIYTTDTKAVYIGDGVTPGGVSVGSSGSGGTGNYYPLSNPNQFIKSGDVNTISGSLQQNIERSGGYLYGLVTSSVAGVANINSASGALTIAGAKGVFVTTNGQNITISGDKYRVFRVKDYGAVGDGVTDDRLAIQSGINDALRYNNSVLEFEPRVYNLTTGVRISGHINTEACLSIQGDNSSLKFKIAGNGATLYSDARRSDVTWSGYKSWHSILRIRAEFDELRFEDLNFSQATTLIPSLDTDYGYECVAFTNKSDKPVGNTYFDKCNFINGHRAANIYSDRNTSYSYPASGTIGKFKKLQFNECKFLYPSGSCTTNPGGGSQIISIGNWVNKCEFNGCYIDGLSGGYIKTNSAFHFPKDGFIFAQHGCALNTSLNNCYFTNYWVEGIYIWPEVPLYLNSTFTQPAIGGNATMVSALSAQPSNTLKTGEIFRVAGGWYNYSYGSYKMTGYTYPNIYAVRVTAQEGNTSEWAGAETVVGGTVPAANIYPIQYDNAYELRVENCIFDTPLIYSGNSGIYRGSPHIRVGNIRSIIKNNIFKNHYDAIDYNIGGPVGGAKNQNLIVENNLFYQPASKSGDNGGYPSASNVVLYNTDNAIIKNNTFIFENSQSVTDAIFMGGHNHLVHDNKFIINNPSPISFRTVVGNVKNACIRLMNNSNPAGWRNLSIKDNFNKGFDVSVSAQDGQNVQSVVENFYGEPQFAHAWGAAIKNVSWPLLNSGNSWVRVGLPQSNGVMNGKVRIGSTKIDFSTNQHSHLSLLNIENNDYLSRVKKARLLRNYQWAFLDIYFSDINEYYDPRPLIEFEDIYGYTRLSSPIYPEYINTVTTGTFGPVLYVPNHGLTDGNWIYFDRSNTTPSLNGNLIVKRIDANNFAVSGNGPVSINLSSTGVRLTGIMRTSNVVTGYGTASHNLEVGDVISVSGGTSAFNIFKAKVTSVPSNLTFCYSQVGSNTSLAAYTGTLYAGQYLVTSGHPNTGYLVEQINLNATTGMNYSERPRVNGTQVLLSGDINASTFNIVDRTSTQTIAGEKTFTNTTRFDAEVVGPYLSSPVGASYIDTNAGALQDGSIQTSLDWLNKVLYGSWYVEGISRGYSTISGALSNTGKMTLDFTVGEYFANILWTGVNTFTGINKPSAGTVLSTSVFINNTGYSGGLSFPSDWTFMATRPTGLVSGKSAILSLKSYGPNVVAGYSVQS